jgi:haloalkane dehalogenase
MITRHFIDVGDRRIHYRKAGSGPPLLMVHQSPRSSAEYAVLMTRWAEHFTCIAPDTPGFGQSDPLPIDRPDIGDFADALIGFLDALGIDRTAAYGFHSGGIILVTTLKKHPDRFTALAVGGYAVWTPEEMALFGDRYLPPFQPSAQGEHLAWLWGRVIEQSWFFPWFATDPEHRLSVAHDDPARIDAVVREMLDSGDHYRAGYGAVLRSPRDTPPPDAVTPPVLITAYDGDPLQPHLDRLGEMPANWWAYPVPNAQALETASLDHLRASPGNPAGPLAEARDEGFVAVAAAGFDGLIHWRGNRGGERIVLHAPGGSVELLDDRDALAIDLPGHGLSDDWPAGHARSLDDWVAVVAAAISALADGNGAVVAGQGLSALLALAVAARTGAPAGGIDAHIPRDPGGWVDAFPDLAPDRFGAYLHKAWGIARAGTLFWPWFDARAGNAIPFDPADLSPERLALVHRSLIRARSARALGAALLGADRDALARAATRRAEWTIAPWAQARDDIWTPQGL